MKKMPPGTSCAEKAANAAKELIEETVLPTAAAMGEEFGHTWSSPVIDAIMDEVAIVQKICEVATRKSPESQPQPVPNPTPAPITVTPPTWWDQHGHKVESFGAGVAAGTVLFAAGVTAPVWVPAVATVKVAATVTAAVGGWLLFSPTQASAAESSGGAATMTITGSPGAYVSTTMQVTPGAYEYWRNTYGKYGK